MEGGLLASVNGLFCDAPPPTEKLKLDVGAETCGLKPILVALPLPNPPKDVLCEFGGILLVLSCGNVCDDPLFGWPKLNALDGKGMVALPFTVLGSTLPNGD